MKTTLGTHTRRRSGSGGFSLIEVLFAIGMLGIGIVGILSLFTTGLSAASWAGNTTSAAMEAQSLYTRIVSDVDVANKRVYLNRINDPDNPTALDPANKWIHDDTNSEVPVKVDQWLVDTGKISAGEMRELYWSCRVAKFPMDLEDPLNPSKDADKKTPAPPGGAKALPNGLYQIAIAVYRNYKPGKEPVVVYTTYVTAGY
jgi:type II secretory pathway pseudopilin PulG